MRLIDLDAARDAIREGFIDGLALFVGAGVSLQSPSNCPSWIDLTSNFIKGVIAVARLDDRLDLRLLLESLPQFMMAALRRPEHTFQVLIDALGEDVLEGLALLRTGDPNLNHILIGGYLWLGGFRAVITTNFDEHLEQTVRLHEQLFGESPSQLPYRHLRGKVVADNERGESRLLWSIHGSLSDLSSVVTSVAATGQSLKPNAIEELRSILDDCTLLVVGYSGNDEDIIEFLLAPETVGRTKGIIWQVLDATQIPPAVERLETAYGEKMIIVQGSADDLFSLTIDPLFIGDIANGLSTWEAALDALRMQWRVMLVSAMPSNYQTTFSAQFDRAFQLIASGQR
ncbi:MAG: SIR2 family protein, partial [Bacteroidota bacterium]